MKIGVIGLGSIGSRHAANIFELGHEVIGYDPAVRRDRQFAHEVFDAADAIVIATPSHCHVGDMRAAAERGKHMLIEKPIAVDRTDVPELLTLAESNNAVVMVGNNLRFHQSVTQAKTWIDEGIIGAPLWAQVTLAQRTDKPPYLRDGVVLNWGAHEIDLALHLLGPAKVACASVRAENGRDDMADFVMVHESGCRTTVHLDYITEPERRDFLIVGTDGTIKGDIFGRTAGHDGKSGRRWQIWSGKIFNFDEDYKAEMCAFIERIQGKETLGATGADGLRTLEIALEVRRMAGLS